MCGPAQAGQGAHTNGLSWLVVLDWLEIGKSIQNHNLPETLFFIVSKYTPCFSDPPVNNTPFTELSFCPQEGNELLLIFDVFAHWKVWTASSNWYNSL